MLASSFSMLHVLLVCSNQYVYTKYSILTNKKYFDYLKHFTFMGKFYVK